MPRSAGELRRAYLCRGTFTARRESGGVHQPLHEAGGRKYRTRTDDSTNRHRCRHRPETYHTPFRERAKEDEPFRSG